MRAQANNPTPALPPDWEVEPKPNLYAFHTPVNAIPYKVQTGDNFLDLAKWSGMSAKRLLEYNFLTTKPQTINWYLRNYIGCTTYSKDGKSYSFRTSDNPGIIEFPSQNYQILMKHKGDHVQPIWDTEYWEVPRVPSMFQGLDSMNCWASSMTAMIRYKTGVIKSTEKTIADLGKQFLDYYKESTRGLSVSEYRQAAAKAGLSEFAFGDRLNPFTWVEKLKKHGPMLVPLNAGGSNTHLVVIKGYQFVYPSTFNLVYMDPAEQFVQTDTLANMVATIDQNAGWPKCYVWWS